jgi:hypothetical protein
MLVRAGGRTGSTGAFAREAGLRREDGRHDRVLARLELDDEVGQSVGVVRPARAARSRLAASFVPSSDAAKRRIPFDLAMLASAAPMCV